jgi:hypothetical protein
LTIPNHHYEDTLMNKLFAAFIAGAFAFASVAAMAQDKTPPPPIDRAALKAERDAARAKWAAMNPEQKAATRKSMAAKRVSELNALEMVATEGPMEGVGADAAKDRSDRAAAKAQWDAMTPEQKAATRKAARAKRVSELTQVEMISVGGQ